MRTDEILERVSKLASREGPKDNKDAEALEHFEMCRREIEKALGNEFFEQ